MPLEDIRNDKISSFNHVQDINVPIDIIEFVLFVKTLV